jgi:hypothetical protein
VSLSSLFSSVLFCVSISVIHLLFYSRWSKAIMAREALLFGQQRSFSELDEAIISIPTDKEVQAVLDKHKSQVAGPSSSTRQA